jgi:hypothetical protein
VNGEDLAWSKSSVKEHLAVLREELDRFLAEEYGQGLSKKSAAYGKWKESHQPFHWFVEFYGIINAGGFDVIIGNPPYVEYSIIRNSYTIQNYETERSSNLYAFVMERCFATARKESQVGLIVPISAFTTDRTISLQKILRKYSSAIWVSNFGIRPSKLFEGAEQRLSIVIYQTKNDSKDTSFFSTKYHRWYTDERPNLLQTMGFQFLNNTVLKFGYAKISTSVEASIFEKMPQNYLGKLFEEKAINYLYWHRIPGYFIKALDFIPYFWSDRDGVKKSEDYKVFGLQNDSIKPVVVAVLNSSLFYWFWFSISDGYHCGKKEVLDFPFDIINMSPRLHDELIMFSSQLMLNLKENSQRRKRGQKTTNVEYDEFSPSYSKPIIDEIDRVLAKHYGFTEEELDFIINYDIKYRMGKNSEEEE